MPSRTTLLSNYPAIRTRDAEYARDRIFALFGATSFDVPSSEKRFETRANHLRVGDLIVYYCAFSSHVSIGSGEVPFIRQISNIDGKVRYSGRKFKRRSRTGRVLGDPAGRHSS
jgi:hypothetical protein